MNGKLALVLVSGLIIGWFGGFWYAENRLSGTGEQVLAGSSTPALAPNLNSLAGTVMEVKENSFVLKIAPAVPFVKQSSGSPEAREVLVVASTKIVRNEYQSKTRTFKEVAIELSDLKEGDLVSVDTEEATSKSFEATRVFLVTAPPTK